MRHTIAHGPAFTVLDLEFEAGEVIRAQPGSMLSMSTGFEVEAVAANQMRGSSRLDRSVRSLLAGENFFTANYTAKRTGERLSLAPEHFGEIRRLAASPEDRWMLATGSFLAAEPSLGLELKYVGITGLMATRGLFVMRTDGSGDVFVSSFGALVEKDLADGERFVVDNRFIVAWSSSIRTELVKVAKSVRQSLLTGEGLVNRYTGPGKVLYQTRGKPDRGLLRGVVGLVT